MRPTRTKIVATLGPASEEPAQIRALIRAGVDVFRLNFSHGTHQSHARYIRTIRDCAEETDQVVAILQDLQGPRIRTGKLKGGEPVTLADDAEVTLEPGEFEGDATTIPVSYANLPQEVEAGDEILLADGMIELEVTASNSHQVRCRVRTGGTIGEHKGINLPGARLSLTAPTEKDIEDLRFGMEQGVDLVALSFVRSADDLRRLREAMREHSGADSVLPIIPKIEKPEAVENLHDILHEADGVMVARGDLGIEMRTEQVPVAQKRIIHLANRHGLPVITATQMLESMVESPRPTRAEASDVANAILDGTDAVMLSGETSIGRYPAVAARMMDRIAREIEQHRREGSTAAPPEIETIASAPEHALANAACMVADRLDAAAIVAFTITGSTARYVSQRRPDAPIYALTPNEATCRRLALVWGVCPIMLEVFDSTDEMIQRGSDRLKNMGVVDAGETVVYVAGASTNTPGGTDMLKIEKFEAREP